MKTYTNSARTSRLLMVALFTLGLAACGGGSSGDDEDPLDTNGLLNGENGGELVIGDTDGDGIVDDLDGDGIADDLDGDGIVNEIVSADACQDQGGSDPGSTDFEWNNNCTITRFGPFTDSLYSKGIQRVVFCRGHGGDVTDINVFSDGEFGPGTEEAVTAFQTAQEIAVDGKVGPETWGELQSVIEFVIADANYDGHGVIGVECDGQVNFYNEIVDEVPGGWELSLTPGSQEKDAFSIVSPF